MFCAESAALVTAAAARCAGVEALIEIEGVVAVGAAASGLLPWKGVE